ncbi:MAG: nucleotidyltransferase [Thalassobius sp.]|nr:nucleotidyltransferase [Thalassovita sp.]
MKIDIETVKQKDWLLFECISGSKAYGLDTPQSDTDIKGVFILPQNHFYGFEQAEQVSNASNDIVYYELRKFVDLLAKNNPNLLEMLHTPEDKVLYKHPLFDKLKPALFLSKMCKDTFAGYAMTQVKKARGLNKKILNPVAKERKSLLHFCYVLEDNGTIPLINWLEKHSINQADCGLSKINHIGNLYAVYYDATGDYKYQGMIKDVHSNDVKLSSIPKDGKLVAHMFFNKDGYSSYCKEYKAYWEWVEKRNDERYQNTLSHGKNYDAKNMMHTFRLLDMAEEILSQEKIIVKRPNRQELLDIRSGKFDYDYLINMAEEKIQRIEDLAFKSKLPEKPDESKIEQLLVSIRQDWYGLNS